MEQVPEITEHLGWLAIRSGRDVFLSPRTVQKTLAEIRDMHRKLGEDRHQRCSCCVRDVLRRVRLPPPCSPPSLLDEFLHFATELSQINVSRIAHGDAVPACRIGARQPAHDLSLQI